MRLDSSRRSFLISSAASVLLNAGARASTIQPLRIPVGGLQPQAAIDSTGAIHLVYMYGDPGASDVAYVCKRSGDKEFSSPIRVNSVPGSAIALGTVRGPRLSIGKNDRVHVAWNGSGTAEPK